MGNFILIGICMIAGMLFRNSNSLPKDAHKGINAWIIYLALPAVSFKYLPHIHWSNALALPLLSPIAVWLGAWLFISWYAKIKKLNKPTEGGLKLAAGLGNTTFIGFPLIIAYFSEKELGIAIIYDQVNFMLLSVAGIIVAINSSQNRTLSVGVIAKKLLRFPPFLCCVAALILPRFINLSPLDEVFNKLAATTGPLALFSIGLQLRFKGWQQHLPNISAALFYKLLIAPCIILGIALLAGIKGTIAHISVFEAAMPTLLTAGIVADEYELNAELVNLVTGIGIILCFITTVGWWLLLRYMA